MKGELVGALHFADPSGSPVGSSAFEVAAAGFGALVAFNAAELAAVTDDVALQTAASSVAAGIDARWSSAAGTWTDDVVTGPGAGAATRVLEALLPVLVSGRDDVVERAFAARDRRAGLRRRLRAGGCPP